MRRCSKCVSLCVLLILGCFLASVYADSGDLSKREKFEELEQEYADSPSYLKLTKASWLTTRGNTYGRQGELGKAVDSFKEAIDIRQDYFPAYISLALAYRAEERYDEAIERIESAPGTMDFNGNELGGFEYDVYYIKMLVYAAVPDHEKGLASAREGLEVLDDPVVKGQRQRAEKFGVVGPGSGTKIVELLEKYVKIRESRNSQ